jgi:hypothetical protein
MKFLTNEDNEYLKKFESKLMITGFYDKVDWVLNDLTINVIEMFPTNRVIFIYEKHNLHTWKKLIGIFKIDDTWEALYYTLQTYFQRKEAKSKQIEQDMENFEKQKEGGNKI